MRGSEIRIRMKKSELRGLCFWAVYGIGKARAGFAVNKTIATIKKYKTRYRFGINDPKLGQYL